MDETTVDAVGKLTEALETTDRARGHLYSFHQLTGHADLMLDEACAGLREAGHDELAELIEQELVGRNVVKDRWTYQLVEDYDAGYWAVFRALEQKVREELTSGVAHMHEAHMRERRRTPGHPDHTIGP